VIAGLQGDTSIITQYLQTLKTTPGFAAGGWATARPTRMDPRDTILARLRPGEYVMSPEEVAAGAPRWGRSGGLTVNVHFPNGFAIGNKREIAEAIVAAVTDAQERRGPGMALPLT
jgi:hypothetical protein